MSKAAQEAMAASYKSLKEDFVSGLTGGNIGEINYITAVAPVSSPIEWTCGRLSNDAGRQLSFYGRHCSRGSPSLVLALL